MPVVKYSADRKPVNITYSEKDTIPTLYPDWSDLAIYGYNYDVTKNVYNTFIFKLLGFIAYLEAYGFENIDQTSFDTDIKPKFNKLPISFKANITVSYHSLKLYKLLSLTIASTPNNVIYVIYDMDVVSYKNYMISGDDLLGVGTFTSSQTNFESYSITFARGLASFDALAGLYYSTNIKKVIFTTNLPNFYINGYKANFKPERLAILYNYGLNTPQKFPSTLINPNGNILSLETLTSGNIIRHFVQTPQRQETIEDESFYNLFFAIRNGYPSMP